ncbi:hypothetical protein Zmor_001197 [Zophobas morio]|uniref:Uncharacterized protein n=1 Tax=Zophobas morio TaxID=2755281 RepID=A0AA38IYM4_9CUCU|nr:hypothetical protein Zmor_001197 [Zophobas morio]
MSTDALKNLNSNSIVQQQLKPLIDVIYELKDNVQNLVKENSYLRAEITKLNNVLSGNVADHSTHVDLEDRSAKISNASLVSKNSKSTIIVKPKDDKQTISKTKSDVIKIVNPLKDNKDGKVKTFKDGRLLVKCNDPTLFKKVTKDKLADVYEVREIKTPGPRIRISGIPKNVDQDDLVSCMKKQNDSIFGEGAVCKVLKFSTINSVGQYLDTCI